MAIINNLVPRYSKKDFETVATEFLQIYCPEALETVTEVPIRKIATEKLGLHIIECHLTEDFSVYAEMCFTSGKAEIYDPENEEYREISVHWGTMIIDPDTLAKRNIGCLNNTIAHECYHWWKHRDYHILQSVIDKQMANTHKNLDFELDEKQQGKWTDEDWMEWQARNVAPRILMPIHTFTQRFNQLLRMASNIYSDFYDIRDYLVDKLSYDFIVSKQSASIRISELGLL
jgi:hypothetical protein